MEKLKKLFRKGQEAATGAATKVIDFFEQQADEQNRPATVAEKTGKAVADYFKPAAKPRNDGSGIADPQLRVRDFLREVPDNVADIGRGTFRSIGAVASKVGQGDIRAQYIPETSFEKSMFGTDKPVSFTTIGKEVRLAGEGDKALPFDPLVGGLIAAADIPSGGRASKGVKESAKAGVKTYEGATKYTTKVLEALKGKATVSRQYIEDMLRKPDIKQSEKDLVNDVLRETPDSKINVSDFAEKVEDRVLPLNIDSYKKNKGYTKYESVNLNPKERGDVISYDEKVYESPVKTQAGTVHFSSDYPNYFGHTRVEDMADGATRRVVELQSDLFQKGRLAREVDDQKPITNEVRRKYLTSAEEKKWQDARRVFLDYRNENMDRTVFDKASRTIEELETKAKKAYIADRKKEVAELEPYKNTWWERMVREEIAQASKDGKKAVQFPTGETAMKVEGLGGNTDMWFDAGRQSEVNRAVDAGETPDITSALAPEDLEVGRTVIQGTRTNGIEWVIVDDSMAATGQFSAIPKGRLEQYDLTPEDLKDKDFVEELKKATDLFNYEEGFTIGEGLDKSNPIFKFYESQVAKYLQKKYGARLVTDKNGVTWMQVDVDPRMANAPVEAFAGFAAGVETDEEGNITGFNPETAALGAGLALVAKKVGNKEVAEQTAALKTAVAKAKDMMKQAGQAAEEMVIYKTPKGALKTVAQSAYKGNAETIALVRKDGTVIDPLDTGPTFKSISAIMDERKGKPPGGEKKMVDMLRPKKNERRFITRTRAMDPNMDQFLKGEMTPRSTDELAAYADDIIEKNIEEATRIAKEGVDDKAVAVASRLIDRYVNAAGEATDDAVRTKMWEAASEIANDAAKNLTEHGRAIQAATLLGRTTPEGMVRFAAKTIQNHNESVRKSKNPLERTIGNLFGNRTGNALKEVPELTGEQAENIVKRMKEIEDITDETQRAMKMKELTDEIQSYLPSSLYKKIVTVWKAGLLTGFKTTGLNVASNTAHFLTEIAKDVPASMIDRVVSLATGKRTLTMTTKGTPKGMVEGAKKGWQYWKTGFDERDIGAKLDYHKVNFGNSKLAKAIQKYEETVFQTIGSQDQPFYYGAKMRSLASQAMAQAKNQKVKGEAKKQFIENLLQNPTDEMLKYAVLDAETAVFQNKTSLGKFAREFQKLPGGEIILPFGKTPSAVATQIVNYSPVGVAKTIIQNIGKGKFDQRLFSQGVGRGLTGTAVMAIGAALYKNGLMTLGFPTSEKERKQWELEGKTPNSIYWNGAWRNVGVLGPAGLATIVGGHFQNGLEETGSVIGGIAQGAAGFGNTMTEQSFLKGINSAIDALKDPERSFSGFASSLAGSIVPTIVADFARATDTVERDAQTPGTRLKSRIPGLRKGLQPKVDTLGNKVKTQGFMTTMFDPTRPGNATAREGDKAIVEELRRLADAGYQTTPTQLGPNKGYESLSPEDNTLLRRAAGQTVKEAIRTVMNNKAYATLDDEQKQKMIDKRVDVAKVEARANIVIKATAGLKGEELKAKLAQMKEEGLLTKEVFKKYQSIKSSN